MVVAICDAVRIKRRVPEPTRLTRLRRVVISMTEASLSGDELWWKPKTKDFYERRRNDDMPVEAVEAGQGCVLSCGLNMAISVYPDTNTHVDQQTDTSMHTCGLATVAIQGSRSVQEARRPLL